MYFLEPLVYLYVRINFVMYFSINLIIIIAHLVHLAVVHKRPKGEGQHRKCREGEAQHGFYRSRYVELAPQVAAKIKQKCSSQNKEKFQEKLFKK